MATYKVPQDVEADDKLIGPFSFRQFIYLIVVAMAGGISWGLAQIFVGLAIIPLPVIVFFGILALPLRKDQPMEIYMAAIISFHLKPRQRMWDPEGIETFIEITAPKTPEVQRAKDLSQNEAAERLSYLADIVDTQGWAIRGVSGTTGTAMNTDAYMEAQTVTDVLDTNTSVAHAFDEMMSQSTERMREEAKQRMFEATVPPAPVAATPQPFVAQPVDPSANVPAPHFNPYPTIHQSVIQPLNDAAHRAESDIPAPAPAPQTVTTPPTNSEISAQPAEPTVADALTNSEKKSATSEAALTAGIINLANNPDVSVETLAHEAHRLEKKAEEASEEVVISLR